MTYDRGSSLFWLAFSLLVFIESFRLGLGALRNPGMGFITFGASGLLGILSLILLLQTMVRKEKSVTGPTEHPFAGSLWKRVLAVIAALLLYTKVMPVAGYLISTFFLMSFLFWIVRGQKWWWVLVSSFLATLATYYLFSVWLGCQFPRGLFGL
jgi:hypothetical protein